MELISDYMTDAASRHLLNDLARKTFGIDFERWVTEGYFEGDYLPYSFVEEGRMLSNVSANKMRFLQNGVERNYIQLGTVMTDEAYRRQGLAGELMRHVIRTYERDWDGIYLFGDLSAAGFYQKLGFRIASETRYSVKEEYCGGRDGMAFQPVLSLGGEFRKKYLEAVRTSAPHSAFEQINKFGLQMFYTAGLDTVYYSAELDCFLVLEQEEDCAVLQSVLCRERVPLQELLRRLAFKNRQCRLGFTPLSEDAALCRSEVYDGGEDYRLFYRGEALESIERDRLYFPELSHA